MNWVKLTFQKQSVFVLEMLIYNEKAEMKQIFQFIERLGGHKEKNMDLV